MARLPKFTLSKDRSKGDWPLINDTSDQVVKRFETKGEATKGGVLERAVGPEGGSVKIKKLDGRIQEERTFPGSKDPPKSKG